MFRAFVGENMYFRIQAQISLFFDQRIKISYASELNSVSFDWHEQHKIVGPLLRTNSPGYRDSDNSCQNIYETELFYQTCWKALLNIWGFPGSLDGNT